MNIPIDRINVADLVANGPMVLVKWFFVIGLGMYALFAFVITRQVVVMTQTIESEANFAVKMFGWVHFILSILLIVAAVVLL